jgi:N-acetylmuramoyl-L-alanine amidase
MSSLTAEIPLSQIERIQIYINSGRKSLATIKKETGADYLINGQLFNAKWAAVVHLKADGYVWATDPYNYYGYAWDAGPDIAMVPIPQTTRRNHIACVELIRNGTPKDKPIYSSQLGGSRGRTAIGIKGGSFAMYCSKDGTAARSTPEGLRDRLFGMGWQSAVMLDGGGSSQCNFSGQQITSTRVVHSLILVYLKKESKNPEDKKMKIYLSPSSQPGNRYAAGNTNEQVQCNRIAEAARIALVRCGFDVKKGPEGQGYPTNVTESNAWGADLHIPIHTNAGGGRGPVVFVYGISAARTKYAQPVFDALNAIVPAKNSRGVQARPDLYETSRTSGLCIYCECAFHDNAQEAQWIINNVTAIGEAICKGVCAGTRVTYVEPKAQPNAAQSAAQKLIDKGWGDVLVAMAEKV